MQLSFYSPKHQQNQVSIPDRDYWLLQPQYLNYMATTELRFNP
ncbi:hypothetical protein PL8927_780130 [Planktothrix serta PCC 8927]|uniref:Uncharacterized protein n=1 Tax=Planktothrix serta PCC 8927 TaxID=671068 RepID=A0A7Z9BYE4_9CYAN|nr:hypothetical protein PL8927_780130 [Planktothrix serta PCC 8927]